MSETLSKRRLKLWIRLLRVTRSAEGELREFLRTEHESTLPRFDVLAALHRARTPLTMSGLSRQLLVSNGNTTTVVDRLELDGLVTRTPAVDRRIIHVSLTDNGRAYFEQLAVDHEARVNQLFGGLSGPDLTALEGLLHRMTRTTETRTTENHTTENHTTENHTTENHTTENHTTENHTTETRTTEKATR